MFSLSNKLEFQKHTMLHHMEYVANLPEIVNLGKLYNDKKLTRKEVHLRAKPLLMRQIHEHNFLGFFLISKAGLSLSSLRESNIGTQNLLVSHDEIWLRIKKNETFITPPIESEVNLMNEEMSLKTNYTMFMVSPIKDGEETLMYLTFRLSPESFIWETLTSERIGDSGESYLINKDGYLLSPSRFQNDLQKLFQDYTPYGEIMRARLPVIASGDSPLNGIRNEFSSTRLVPYPDYRGIPVIGTWKWLPGYQLGLVIERDFDEAFKNHENSKIILWIIFGIVSLIISFVSNLAWRGREKVAESARQMKEHLSRVDATVISYEPLNDFYIHAVNEHLHRILGIPKEDVLGQSLMNWIHPDDHEDYKKTVMHNMIDKRSYEHSFRIKTAKKDIYVMEKAQFQRHGKDFYVESFMTDITEQKQMSQRLMKQITLSSVFQILLKHASRFKTDDDLFSFVVELLVDYQIAEIHSGSVYSIDENKNLQIICEVGESEDEIEGFISRWEDSTRLKTQIKQGQPVTETIDDDREELYMPLQEEGRVVALLKLNKTNFENFDSQEIQFLLSLVNIVSEILHRINIDDELARERENKVKTERLAAVGEISDSLAHEINNPLMIIKGMTQLMKRNIKKERYERLERTLKDVDMATDRISLLISSLRLFNRNHHSKMEQIDFKPFFTSLMIETSIMTEKSDILLRYENQLDGILYGDKEELKFVLLKYITECCNVVRTQEQREIFIQTEYLHDRVKLHIKNAFPPSDQEIMKNIEGDKMVEKKLEGVNLWKNVVELNMGHVSFINDHV